MFQTLKLEGEWWAVFIINAMDAGDRYMLTSPLDTKRDADKFCDEFKRIAALDEIQVTT